MNFNLKCRDQVYVSSIPGWMPISKPLRVQITYISNNMLDYNFYATSLDEVVFSDPAYNISQGMVFGFNYSDLCNRQFRLI